MNRNQWDFSACLPSELASCWGYEFARECPEFRNKVARLRQQIEGNTFDAYFPEDSARCLFQTSPQSELLKIARDCGVFPFCEQWPEQPYLSIDAPIRADRVARVSAHKLPHIQEIPHGDCDREPDHETTVARFYINWTASNGQLLKEFDAWIKASRPPGVQIAETRGKAGNESLWKKELKALGALRLLREMDWTKAEVESQKYLGDALFSNQSSWIRAGHDAEEAIQRFIAG